ncbi:amidohydrolase [Roseibium sp.]|uniref:amidohydrolase n=1 Tax=Roseibium sp. TaxID=1936156 RepID=UPI003B525914
MAIDLNQLVQLRHWLHAHPEVSREEVETAKHLRAFLAEHAAPDEFVELDAAGFAAVYNGAASGKTVMIRAELDALPIHEVNTDINYRSLYDGVGHKCGHDGHMTILAGLAQTLAERPFKGRVVLLFQPDEETGTGARNCCLHQNFKQIEPDFAFALHNLPGFSKGSVICKIGTFASAVKYMALTFTGKEAHSAQPETGASPSFAMAELTLKAREIQAKYDTPAAYALIVPVYTEMGVQASGVCPGYGEVHVTLRAAQSAVVESMWDDLSAFARTLADDYGLDFNFETREEFAANANSQLAFDMIKAASVQAGSEFILIDKPFRWGEDFGEITNRFEGGMFGLGAGEALPDLHNPDYDFPDDLLMPGITMFSNLIQLALSGDLKTDTEEAASN